MTWQNRLQQAAYTSPSGVRIEFDYENVSKAFDKKTTGFNFPDANGTYVQDLGHSGQRYPMRVIFWGNDHDLEAQEFENALQERGEGRLEHPIYNDITVVPFGTITQRDDLKTAANQSIIEVVFWETIGLVYPSSQSDPASNVLTSIDEYNTGAANEFEDLTSLKSAVEQSVFQNNYTAILNQIKLGLQAVADTQEDVKKEFDNIFNSINTSIDILVSTPINLAFQTILLVQSPGRALTNIEARLSAYGDLASAIISGSGVAVQGNDSTNSNTFHTNDLYASTLVTGQVLSVVNNTFFSKPEALGAAEVIIAQFNELAAWRDDNFESLGEIDTGEAYQKLLDAVSVAVGFLVEISFTLKQERRLILDRDRTVIDLVAELYGSIDDQLDFFISSNNLTGSEILELPAGREIVYYI
jgi:prophage DNA circulation protein